MARDLTDTPALPAGLLEHARQFDFFQAVRLLEQDKPGAVPVGEGADPAREAVRFRAKVGFEFSSTDVVRAGTADQYGRTVLDVAFMGLAGAEGPLPAPYCEQVMERAVPDGAQPIPGGANDDLRDFLDIFNHRLISQFYRGRKKHHLALGADPVAGQDALLEEILLELIGFHEGRATARNKVGRLARVLLRYAGILAGTGRSLAALEALLSDALNAPVRALGPIGRWLPVDPHFRTALGPTLGRNCRLGQDTVIGRRSWDACGGIALEIGPLDVETYETLLPGGAHSKLLTFLTRFFLREDLDVEVRLLLRDGPGKAAGTAGLGRARLGRTAWLQPGAPAGSKPDRDFVGPPRARDAGRYPLPRWSGA